MNEQNLQKKIKLSTVAAPWLDLPEELDLELTGVSMDSRLVKPGNLFLACFGISNDGHKFIADALAKGAIAVISETTGQPEICRLEAGVPHLRVPGVKEIVNKISGLFYDTPAEKLQIFGVTGTNGKSSVVHFVAQLSSFLRIPCGIISTVNYQFADYSEPVTHTTPEPLTIQKLLANFHLRGAKQVSLEVSSHALAQYRVHGLPISIAAFTNLTHDHLDYHGSLENYAQAKELLFKFPSVKQAVINVDDEFGEYLANTYRNFLEVLVYSIDPNRSIPPGIKFLQVKEFIPTEDGWEISLSSSWGEAKVRLKMLAKFAVQNVLAALGVQLLSGQDFGSLLKFLPELKMPAGRLELLQAPDGLRVVVDYAHTPDAIYKALLPLKERCKGKVWCVFGCGGNRDQTKRAEMARFVEQVADNIIVTSDNPRCEDPQQIIRDICAGFSEKLSPLIITDRAEAIEYAVATASSDDIILLAGKGHESYQEISGIRYKFSDQEQVMKLQRFIGRV